METITMRKRIHDVCWKTEEWVQMVFIPYMRIPFYIFAAFWILATVDYGLKGNKKDISSLPKTVQERYEFLSKEEIALWITQSKYRTKWEFEKEKEINKKRVPLLMELNQIHASAPYLSWGCRVYNYTKEILWGIKPN